MPNINHGQPIVCYHSQKKGGSCSESQKLKLDTASGIRMDKVTTVAKAVPACGPNNSLFMAISSTYLPAGRHQWLLDSG